jgi:hypothetical protein
LPAAAVDPIPRTRAFWIVWGASGLSLIVILYVDVVAEAFRVAAPVTSDGLVVATLAGTIAVGWRLIAHAVAAPAERTSR